MISFCTPKDTEFIREIVMVDDKSHDNLNIFYVISRKARVLYYTIGRLPKFACATQDTLIIELAGCPSLGEGR